MHSPHNPLSSPALSALGWDETFAALFTEHAAAGLVPARVARVDRGLCDTLTAVGPVRADSRPTSTPSSSRSRSRHQ
ncbi:hypothetical protein [Hoyosella altamirensis]|uniref:Uncharacterized protein n=1 Tax=Hoyosella altamirensis TaxID=616997 RepID=A0A839RSQ6_9ACTN|nr:hypothetical protein [Hoyosella altamirensis]MBB3039387.1 hypothetical protein [Hoyosella altamirensis]